MVDEGASIFDVIEEEQRPGGTTAAAMTVMGFYVGRISFDIDGQGTLYTPYNVN